MVASSDIVELARQFAGPDFQCNDDADIFQSGDLNGDDAQQFMDEYVRTYSVDMQNFLNFFHNIGGGSSTARGVKPIGLDGKVFPPIPITPRLLADAANQEKWPLEYPTHTLRTSRWPLIFMFIFLAAFVLAVTVLIADN